jgi:hypothetical protein
LIAVTCNSERKHIWFAPGVADNSYNNVWLCLSWVVYLMLQIVLKSQIYAGGRGLGTFTNGLKGGVHIATVNKVTTGPQQQQQQQRRRRRRASELQQQDFHYLSESSEWAHIAAVAHARGGWWSSFISQLLAV